MRVINVLWGLRHTHVQTTHPTIYYNKVHRATKICIHVPKTQYLPNAYIYIGMYLKLRKQQKIAKNLKCKKKI